MRNIFKYLVDLMMHFISIFVIPILAFAFLAVTAFFLISGFPQPDVVTHTPVAQLVSPDGRWTVDITDIRYETDWFHITDLDSEGRVQRAGSTGNSTLIVGSATNSDPELRPQARWIAPDRLCVVTPRIDGMAVRSDNVAGARVDVHILPWNQKWPPPKIDLDAQCR
jgi:hypothetical protein